MELSRQTIDFEHARESMAAMGQTDRWDSYAAVAWAIFAITVALRWTAGFLLLRVFRRGSVRFSVLVLFLTPLLSWMGNLGAVVAIFGNGAARTMVADVVAGLLSGMLVAAVWTAYLLRSRRVRNTYPRVSRAVAT
jgi:hypothetical protein